MYDQERDEYREKHLGGHGCFYWLICLLWIMANVCAVVAGEMIIASAASLLQPQWGNSLLSLQGDIKRSGADGYLAALLGGLGAGALVGLAQGLVLLPFLKLKTAIYWVVATVIGWNLRWFLLFVISQQLAGLVVDRYIEGGCLLLMLLIGIACIAGFATGYPQTLILRPRFHHPMWWLFANVAGPCAMVVLILLGLSIEGYNPYRQSSPIIIAAISSIATGIALMDLLRHPIGQAEWQHHLKWTHERRSRQTEDTVDTVLGSTLYGPAGADPTSNKETSDSQPHSGS